MSEFYRFFAARWDDGVQTLSRDAELALLKICNYVCTFDEAMPDDERLLGALMRGSIRLARTCKEELLRHGKIRIEKNRIHQVRADFELETRSKLARNRADSGAKGGRNRYEKSKKPNENNKTVQAKDPLIEENRIEEIAPSALLARSKERKKPEGDTQFDGWFQEFLTFFPKREDPEHVGAIKRAYGRALQKHKLDPPKLNLQASAYARRVQADGTEPRFVVSAVKWLEQERWNYDYSKSHQPGAGRGARNGKFKPTNDYLDELDAAHGIVRDKDGGFTVVGEEGEDPGGVASDMPRLLDVP